MTSSFPYLNVLLLVPAIGAICVGAMGKAPAKSARNVALLFSLVTFFVSVAMLFSFKTGFAGFQFTVHYTYATQLGLSWHLGIDGISLFLVMLTTLLVPLVILGAAPEQKSAAFFGWLLLLQAASLLSFMSLDVLLFFLAFELTLIPSYFLIAGWGHERRALAAVKFFVMTFVGSAFLLVGIVVVAFLHKSQTGKLTFDLPALMHTHLSGSTGVLLSLCFLAAFAIKAPIFPLHTWSPLAYREAPAGAAMVLSAILAKLGTYGIVRFNLSLFPHASMTLAPLLLTLATIGILYGAIVACAQQDMKRLVAYSSLAQVGFIVLGTFAFTTQGLSGAVVMMFNHGIITAAFFMVIGWIYQRRGTFSVADLKGLQGPAPVLAAVFTVIMLASIGLPGLSGFVGEYLVLIGTFIGHRWWAVVATLGVIFAAMYLLWAYQQAFHGKAEGENAKIVDLSLAERLTVAPLIILIVALGIFPGPMLDRINPSVQKLVTTIDFADCGGKPTTTAVPGTVICAGTTYHVGHWEPYSASMSASLERMSQ